MIAPENQERMAARIAPRKIVTLDASHASLASRAKEVAALIDEAAVATPTSAAQDAQQAWPAAAAGSEAEGGQVEAAVGHGRTPEVAAADRPGETEQAIEHPVFHADHP